MGNITLGFGKENDGIVQDVDVYMWLTHALQVRQREKFKKFKLECHSWILCKTLLLSDICRGQVKEEDVEAVGRTTTNCHRPLTNEPS